MTTTNPVLDAFDRHRAGKNVKWRRLTRGQIIAIIEMADRYGPVTLLRKARRALVIHDDREPST